MSYALIASNIKELENDPLTKKQYVMENKWTNKNTMIAILTLDIINNELIETKYFCKNICYIISSYTIFTISIDVQWTNLHEWLQRLPKQLSSLCFSNSICTEESKSTLNRSLDNFMVQNLCETFNFDGISNEYIINSKLVCFIEMKKVKESNIIIYINEILFCKTTNTNSRCYKISLEFYETFIQDLLKINNLQDFIDFVNTMNIRSGQRKLNNFLVTFKNGDRKLTKYKETWEAFRKIFGPRLIYRLLKTIF
jgi:hypothetical protein